MCLHWFGCWLGLLLGPGVLSARTSPCGRCVGVVALVGALFLRLDSLRRERPRGRQPHELSRQNKAPQQSTVAKQEWP
jgi:hypothetical protein